LRIPTTIPESPRRITIGKRIRESVTSSSSLYGNGAISHGASRMKSTVRVPRPMSISQKSVEATRQARARSPFSSSSPNTGTKAPESAESATRARMVFGIRNAISKALIGPRTPK
jgi:hypothetical protein